MSYRIALASSDGAHVDLHFGEAASFLIYEVSDDGSFTLAETRDYGGAEEGGPEGGCGVASCGSGDGCGSVGGGCGQGGGQSAKVQLISDCRCVVAAKIGFNVTKQLEKKAIASFDVDCTVQEALEKITKYFYSVDNHVSLARR